MACNEICKRYRAKKPKKGPRYGSGQKRCQTCEIFINYEGIWCPCCGYRLRMKPRNIKYRQILNASRQILVFPQVKTPNP